MKQLYIGKNKAYATDVTMADITAVADGTFALFSLEDGKLITAAPTSNFAIVLGRGTNKAPFVFSEVDYKTLQVTKTPGKDTEAIAATTFTAKITVPTPTKGTEYTVLITKKGTVFNERNLWSFNALAGSTIAADVAKRIEAEINANAESLGCTAESSDGTITITASEAGKDYEVMGADGLMGVAPTNVTHGKKAFGDKAYIQDLASRCAADKGFEYTDNAEIYPGYPEDVEDTTYVIYTLRFAVPRVSAKQRDEVVWQTVHLAVPKRASVISTFNTIFGTP